MSANQWKAVIVILDCAGRHLPTLYRMTLCAVGAKFATVNIRVAIRAVLAYVLEVQTSVALHARDLLVHATQRIPSAFVLELGHGANRLPTQLGMAILARHRHGSVRIGHLGTRTLLRPPCLLLRGDARHQGQHPSSNHHQPSFPIHGSLRHSTKVTAPKTTTRKRYEAKSFNIMSAKSVVNYKQPRQQKAMQISPYRRLIIFLVSGNNRK